MSHLLKRLEALEEAKATARLRAPKTDIERAERLRALMQAADNPIADAKTQHAAARIRELLDVARARRDAYELG